jgi:hypothetical protein
MTTADLRNRLTRLGFLANGGDRRGLDAAHRYSLRLMLEGAGLLALDALARISFGDGMRGAAA